VLNKSEIPLAPKQIVEIIYAKYSKSLWPAAERGVILHLIKLEDEGVTKRLLPVSNIESLRGKWALINSKI
jgi:ribonuclease/clavin/mitogillin